MRLLFFIPHSGLLSKQGHTHYLYAFLSSLPVCELQFLVPEGSDCQDLLAHYPGIVHSFRAPSLFGIKAPQLIDLSFDYRRRLAQIVDEQQIDAVIFDFPWGLAAAGKHLGVPAIYFSHGVEGDFGAVMLANFRLSFPPLPALLNWVVRQIERRACHRADQIISVSQNDCDRLAALYQLPPERCWYFPVPVATASPGRELTDAQDTRTHTREQFGLPHSAQIVLFHGSWKHFPNREAIQVIRSEIAPRCAAEAAELLFLIAGTGVPKFAEGNVVSLGFVEDLDSLMRSVDIGLVPVYSGCGVRMKLFDYFKYGVPVVSTGKGVEGLAVSNGTEVLIADDPVSDLPELVLRAARSAELCEAVAAAATRYLQIHHHPEIIKATLDLRLQRYHPTGSGAPIFNRANSREETRSKIRE